MKRFVLLVAAALRAMLVRLQNLMRRSMGLPPLDETTDVQAEAAEALTAAPAAEQPSLGQAVTGWINARLHGAALPDMRGVPDSVIAWLESMDGSELARAVMRSPTQIEEHISGRKKIADVPQVVPMEVYRERAAAAVRAAEREATMAAETSQILEDLANGTSVADEQDARYAAEYEARRKVA